MKKGDIVRIKRPESYWYNECGKVISVDTSGIIYPISVKFDKVDYKVYSGQDGGNTMNYFAEDELEVVWQNSQVNYQSIVETQVI